MCRYGHFERHTPAVLSCAEPRHAAPVGCAARRVVLRRTDRVPCARGARRRRSRHAPPSDPLSPTPSSTGASAGTGVRAHTGTPPRGRRSSLSALSETLIAQFKQSLGRLVRYDAVRIANRSYECRADRHAACVPAHAHACVHVVRACVCACACACVCSMIERTAPHYIRCINPNAEKRPHIFAHR